MTRFGGDDRGQTAFDFAVGMGVFLITVGFILTFIPGVFAPFNVGSGTDEIVGDRVASTLAQDVLVEDPGSRATLDRECTIAFFDADDTDTGCRFDDSAALTDVVGVEGKSINVTLRRNGAIAGLGPVSELVKGPSPADDADVSASQRMVMIDGDVYELVVRVW